jgi:hypothetical protein
MINLKFKSKNEVIINLLGFKKIYTFFEKIIYRFLYLND